MSAIAAYPEPLAGELREGGELVAVLAVAIVAEQREPMFLVAGAETGDVTYVNASEVRLFPLLPTGNDEDAAY